MTGADVAGVLELRRRVHWNAGPQAFVILLEGFPSARWAVAEAPSGSLVGMVGAVPLGEVGILCHLAVHPAHRGRGLGTQLSRWAITYLRSQGARVVRLESTPVAEKLYESLGFRRAGALPSGIKPGVRPGIDGEYRVAPLKASDLPEVYGLDRRSFGGDRSARIEALLRRQGGSGPAMRRDGWRDTSSAAESAWVPGWPLPRRPGGR
jgi:GNAT superfamily N-acetyltransferase